MRQVKEQYPYPDVEQMPSRRGVLAFLAGVAAFPLPAWAEGSRMRMRRDSGARAPVLQDVTMPFGALTKALQGGHG